MFSPSGLAAPSTQASPIDANAAMQAAHALPRCVGRMSVLETTCQP